MSETRPFVVVDFPGNPRRVIAQPDAVLSTRSLADVREVIAEAERAALRGAWVAGFISYEAAPAFEPAMRVADGARMPLAWFAVSQSVGEEIHTPAATPTPHKWSLTPSIEEYRAQVELIREAIADGQTYQVNLTARLSASFVDDAFTFYEAMRRAQGGGYHAYIDTGDYIVASASPELFFEVHDGRIRTRPMKGTRPRGRWTDEDRALAEDLVRSGKDRAENLMIVDLLRNDLGRIAEVGSVQVTSLFDVERYRTVLQLTSTIEGDLGRNVTLADIFTALFPCGSVTGAPKINTMRLITELERVPREVYCGAIGIIAPGGSATFNVPIRTVWLDEQTKVGVYGTGAGITYESNADAECAEIVAKVAVLMEAWPEFELLETMRCEHGAVVRADEHVARLMASASYFDVPVLEDSVRAALLEAVQRCEDPGRVRLLVDADGCVRTDTCPLVPMAETTATLAKSPVASTDRFLFHKTTNRAVYESHRAAQAGTADVLLWNERGEITEFTRGNVVVEIDGIRLTPRLDCGLLPGIFRAGLLEGGEVVEGLVLTADLARATGLWLINSLREWVPARLAH